MLSAETASGEYPLESVKIMDRIVTSTEQDPNYGSIMHASDSRPEATANDAIALASANVSSTLAAAAVVCYTMSGSTALRVARERPDAPVLVLTNKNETAQCLTLLWGAHCVLTSDVRTTTEMVEKATVIAEREGLAKPGERLVITAGMPFGTPGTTNVLRIATVGE